MRCHFMRHGMYSMHVLSQVISRAVSCCIMLYQHAYKGWSFVALRRRRWLQTMQSWQWQPQTPCSTSMRAWLPAHSAPPGTLTKGRAY